MTLALRLPRPPTVARAAPREAPLEAPLGRLRSRASCAVPPPVARPPPREAPLGAAVGLLRSRASFAGLLLLSPAIYYVLPVATIIGLEISSVRIPHVEISPGQSSDPPRFRKLCDSYLEPLCLALGLLLLLFQPYYLVAEPGRHGMHVDAPQHQ